MQNGISICAPCRVQVIWECEKRSGINVNFEWLVGGEGWLSDGHYRPWVTLDNQRVRAWDEAGAPVHLWVKVESVSPCFTNICRPNLYDSMNWIIKLVLEVVEAYWHRGVCCWDLHPVSELGAGSWVRGEHIQLKVLRPWWDVLRLGRGKGAFWNCGWIWTTYYV